MSVVGNPLPVADTALVRHALELAAEHRASPRRPASPPIRKRLHRFSGWLDDALLACREPSTLLERAAGWMLDNDYQIRRAVRQIEKDLPDGFYDRLTTLDGGVADGLPRVLQLVHDALVQMHLGPDLESLITYVDAYQQVTALDEAELWALPALARLVCLDLLVDAMRELGVPPPESTEALPFEARAAIPDATTRVAGAITSLATIAEIDWSAFVDRTSELDAALSRDPAGAYATTDRATRSRYRREVERLARHAGLTELEVVAKVFELARDAADGSRRAHVGFWLIDAGLLEIEAALCVECSLRTRLRRSLVRHAGALYAGSLLLVFALALAVPASYLGWIDAAPVPVIVALLLSVLPASVLSISVVHHLIARFRPPRTLPALDPRHGLPPDSATAVVIPSIVGSIDAARHLLERLELAALANPEAAVTHVLLSDPADADEERLPDDAAIEAVLVGGIRHLNERHRGVARFLLLHRHRQFNEREGCWMAWERKRGKLEQFASLVVEGWLAPFVVHEGDLERLGQLRYMLSLDADTTLAPGSAARLVCMLSHPLNRARIDTVTGRVTDGYTILQPRVEPLGLYESGTPFTRLFAGDCAIDIYSRAVSDVYQDLFGSGSYVGKGIIDIRAFRQSLDGRVPDNAILSHDLFEGLHGRVALASDIVLYESYPENWSAWAARQHRWVRGDWQLLPWLRRSVPARGGGRVRSVFSRVDRWKLVDNLRRSVLPIALFVFFVAGWFMLPGNPGVWTLLGLGAFMPYLFDEAFAGLARLTRRRPLLRERGAGHRLNEQTRRGATAIALLVPDAVVAIDAIGRTGWRLAFSRRHLLEWTPFVASSRNAAHGQSTTHGHLAVTPVLYSGPIAALLVAVPLGMRDPVALAAAAPILLAWLGAPWLAARLGRHQGLRRESLPLAEQRFLRVAARRIWHYFETFCTPLDHWLPPDNFQSRPGPILAHRTSPTNIGLYLTSVVAARDLGHIGMRELAVRGRSLFDTLARLEQHHGHLLNWYDTRTLAPLAPRYVSTVDSGNLAVCLIAFGATCDGLSHAGMLDTESRGGLLDTLGVLSDELPAFAPEASARLRVTRLAVVTGVEALEGVGVRKTLQVLIDRDWPAHEQAIADAFGASGSRGSRRPVSGASPSSGEPAELQDLREDDTQEAMATALCETHLWLERFDHQLRALARDLDALMPWLSVLDAVPPGGSTLAAAIESSLAVDVPFARQIPAAVALRASLGSVGGDWAQAMEASIGSGIERQKALLAELAALATQARALAHGMDFGWLYDETRHLFRIGHDVGRGIVDDNHYDLLASEARMASFFAIAKHDVPLDHWFRLGRPIVRQHGRPVAQSWNGSMFEYLMPPLFLPGGRDTLLGESEALAVDQQVEYAKRLGLPWGVSESAYAATDAEGRYQYRAFGTPGLGIRRGLDEDAVIAPYASMLALAVRPVAAVANLRRLDALGAQRRYGYIDALDFTSVRQAAVGRGVGPGVGKGVGDRFCAVEIWMAHHQGMSLAAILNVLHDDSLPRRVLADPGLHALELLLQERVPWDAPVEAARAIESDSPTDAPHLPAVPGPWIPSGPPELAQWQLLGNGRLSAHVSRRGDATLYWRGYAVTRRHVDAFSDAGYRLHIRSMTPMADASIDPGAWLGSNGDGTSPASFSAERVEFGRRSHGIGVRSVVAIAPRGDTDVRLVSITNERDVECLVVVTSFAEVALSIPADEERHPAFQRLFVGSHAEPAIDGVSFERRPRERAAHAPALVHRMIGDGSRVRLLGFETDRARWYGRLGDAEHPQALRDGLSGTTGWTLDPVMALQVEVLVAPRSTHEVVFATLVGERRDAVLQRAASLSVQVLARTADDAARDTARELAGLKLDAARLPLLQALATFLLHPHAALRVTPARDEAGVRSQTEMWSLGLSGDRPILLLRMREEDDPALLETLVRALGFWRRRGLETDLVVLRVGPAGYDEPLRLKVMDSLRDAGLDGWFGRDGGVHLVSTGTLEPAQVHALELASTVVLDASCDLGKRLDDVLVPAPRTPRLAPVGAVPIPAIAPVARPHGLRFDNGCGGFDPATSEYVIHLVAGRTTPAPWCNVLANQRFGSVVSESGLGFSWGLNSGEHRLSNWSNDPVRDAPGECLWLRDETTGESWSPMPAPPTHDTAIEVRHGFGHGSWRRQDHGLEQTLIVVVDRDDPVKLLRLRLVDRVGIARRLTVTFAVDWVLGAVPSRSRPHVVCEYDANLGAIVAHNDWHDEFAGRVAFVTSNRPPHGVTGDRRDFLGAAADFRRPAALARSDLGGTFTPGAEACAAWQVHIDLEAGGETEVVFVLGEGDDAGEAAALIERWRKTPDVDGALARLDAWWSGIAAPLQVRSPDAGFDLMVNRWLIYQSVSSRLFARAGFYQAGGAFGFRDQLQDVLALLPSKPALALERIRDAAQRQFEEGDTLHWWHPPAGRGVRTRISDDRLWLPWVIARYVETTGDSSLLDEVLPFLDARPLDPGEHDRYAEFDRGAGGTLLEHACRAIDCGLETGAHGLPLIGTGDWNDGLDRVGVEGRGESVWLAWFRIAVVGLFAPLAEARGESARGQRWRRHAESLKGAIDAEAWDGRWYVRAFDDAGEPWGASGNDECRIDVIAQAWGVLAGFGDEPRVRTALESARRELVDEDARLVRLFTPPFHATERDPGYIKAYPPGVRENGGQYTHAATWLGLAFAGIGDGDAAFDVFDIVSPVGRARDARGVKRYQREPYVVAADVAGAEPHIGCGGWSWYTGAASWAWQLGVHGLLGVHWTSGGVRIEPCLPRGWSHVELDLASPDPTLGSISVSIDLSDDQAIKRPMEALGGAPGGKREPPRRGVVRTRVDGTPHTTGAIPFPARGLVRQVSIDLDVDQAVDAREASG